MEVKCSFPPIHRTFSISSNRGEIIWLVKKDGFSTAGLATDDKNIESLIAEGDKPGDLWKQGLLFEDLGIQ